jgi:hypothetical protein
MTEPTSDCEVSESGLDSNLKIGFWAAIVNFIFGLFFLATVAASFIALKGPPVGIYLTLTSVASLIGAVALVFLWSAVHISTPPNRQIFSLSSLAMITILAALTCLTRIVQISLVPQALAAGKTDGLSWFLVYGELSVMADIEVLAWGGFLGLAMLFLAPVFRQRKQERTIFWTLTISGILCLIGLMGKVLVIPVLIFVGVAGWGLGLTITTALMVFWFRGRLQHLY